MSRGREQPRRSIELRPSAWPFTDGYSGDGLSARDGTLAGDGFSAGDGLLADDGALAGAGFAAGDGLLAGDGALAGAGFAAGDGLSAGDGALAGAGFAAGDGLLAGDGALAGDDFSAGEGLAPPSARLKFIVMVVVTSVCKGFENFHCLTASMAAWVSAGGPLSASTSLTPPSPSRLTCKITRP